MGGNSEAEIKIPKEEVAPDRTDGGAQKEKKKKHKKVASGGGCTVKEVSVLALADEEFNKKKHHRSRKKHHFNEIRAQMEFYFGDSNLSKDRFLKQLIDKEPFVPLDVFLTFNKLKTLTSSVEEIAKSLANSKLLELDEAQQKVRRKTALLLPEERNVDEKTLYVEALPPSADHDWVRQTFERFGAVMYVSLPKYAKSRKIKEFGFVEFEQESSVEKAVKAFREFNGVLCMVDTDPSELTSVKSYIKEQNNEEDVKEVATDDKNESKRKRKTVQETDGAEEPKTKKSKTEGDDISTASAAEVDDDTTSETADETADDDNKPQEDVVGGDSSAATKKKRRKKKTKSKTNEKRKKDTELNTDASYFELKVLPKRDWKRLRNKYLNLQREKIAAVKRKAWKEQQQAQQQAKDNDAETSDVAPSPAKKSKPANERKLHRMNMNFYGAGGEDETQTKQAVKEAKQNPALERAPKFSYEPGIIVEVGFMEPCVNVKEFKADMRQYNTVKYVDVKEGTVHAHLRLDTAAAAEDFVSQVGCAEYKCKILAGEAESEYWKKIELDREMKLNKQIKVPQKRGREKIKKLITKQIHIRFGDDDAE